MNKRIEKNNRTMTKQAPSLRAKIAQRVACLACGPARREGWPDGNEAVKRGDCASRPAHSAVSDPPSIARESADAATLSHALSCAAVALELLAYRSIRFLEWCFMIGAWVDPRFYAPAQSIDPVSVVPGTRNGPDCSRLLINPSSPPDDQRSDEQRIRGRATPPSSLLSAMSSRDSRRELFLHSGHYS